MRWTRFQNAAALVLTLALAGCASTAPLASLPAHAGGKIRAINEGYSLLYKLMSDESRVHLILILKRADEPLAGIIKEISGVCGDAKTQMSEFPKTDKEMEFDLTDLPAMEQRTRELIAAQQQHLLLHSSGPEFELNLILTQVQAMNYAVYLTKALEEQDKDPGRRDFLVNLEKHSADLRDRLTKELAIRT